MYYTSTMPQVLRAVVSLKQWSASENDVCSAIMEERVSNLQMLSVLLIVVGFCMLVLTGVSAAFAIFGLSVMAVGAKQLRKEDVDE